jgi:UDP-N-acetyl-D-galactosamine dehydrogenase
MYSDFMEETAAAVEYFGNNKGYVLIDVKGIFDRHEAESMGYLYWRL